ncbi:hypothetical protein [Geminicoccus harenae]|uniref:hypothetical protein n=1 Tax=Geminicoccus harenae TaxID=2498453 RepID=UPI001C940606|nr:hypothetical protein [Geminicoccus harenae]
MMHRATARWLLACCAWAALAGSVQAQPRPLFEDQPPARSAGPASPPSELTVRPLDVPSADAVGSGQWQGSAAWGDTPPAEIASALAALPADPADPTARRLQVELLLLPTPQGQPSGSLLALRLQRLVELGALDAAQALVDEAGPGAIRLAALAPVAASLDLAAGQDEAACALVRDAGMAGWGQEAGGPEGSGELNLLCALLEDRPDSALVLANALQETGSLRAQPFGTLVAVALGYGRTDAVDWSATVTPADLALARKLGLALPDEAVAHASAAALARLAVDPATPPALRASARARVEAARGNFAATGAEASRLRAITDPQARAREIVLLWHAHPGPDSRRAYLPQLAPLAATIAPRQALALEAETLARILLAAGEEGAALSWFDMLEAQPQGDRARAHRVAVLMILAGLVDPSRMPPAPDGLFDRDDATLLAAGLAGQGVPLSSPWERLLPAAASPPPAGAPALRLARALADLASPEPAALARGLAGLVASDRAMDAREIARSTVIVRLDG